MALLYHWQRENYAEDIRQLDPAAGLTLQQNSPAFAEADPDERLWAFTRRQDGTYVLAAQLRVARVDTGAGGAYGRFRVLPAPETTLLYDVARGQDAEGLIRGLSVRADAVVLGQSFQGPAAVRRISEDDDARLEAFAEELPLLTDPDDVPDREQEERWWAALLRNAEVARTRGEIFESPVRGSRYRVETVESDRIRIGRLDAREPVDLTRNRVQLAAQRISAAGGRVPRGSEFSTVAKETAFVEFHPAFQWDPSRSWIGLTAEADTVRPLRLYADYSRREVHDIFAPDTQFHPQTGTWGLHGIVRIPDRPGDYVFFVTFGQQQGEHVFEEGVTEDGVLTWQSQPRQTLSNPQIQEFIQHDESRNSVYLFLRTRPGTDYTYLGRLKYLSHDREREQPVYFKWQVLPEIIPSVVAERSGLQLEPAGETDEDPPAPPAGLVETSPPVARPRAGEPSHSFRGRRRGDYAERDARNRELGLAGELLVLEWEREALRAAGRADLAGRVRHTAVVEGDGAGYDIESLTPEGKPKYIEVKTTRGPAATPFFMSPNELAFAALHAADYRLYRVYEFQAEPPSGHVYIMEGDPGAQFECTPTQYQLRPRAAAEA